MFPIRDGIHPVLTKRDIERNRGITPNRTPNEILDCLGRGLEGTRILNRQEVSDFGQTYFTEFTQQEWIYTR